MLKYKIRKQIDLQDWDTLVQETYQRPYNFQQQDGCQPRGTFTLQIPTDETWEEEEMNDSIPEIVNGEEMGVKFPVWLARDPKAPVDGKTDYSIDLFWKRNFYPSIYTVANDLYEKGLIEAGEYDIKIDW